MLDIALIRPPPPGLGSAHHQAIKLLKNIMCSSKIALWTGKRDNKQALASNFLPAVLWGAKESMSDRNLTSAHTCEPRRGNGWQHLKFGAPIWGNIWSAFKIWTAPTVYHTLTSCINTTLQRVRAFSGLQLLSPAAGLIPRLYFSQHDTKPSHDSATKKASKHCFHTSLTWFGIEYFWGKQPWNTKSKIAEAELN